MATYDLQALTVTQGGTTGTRADRPPLKLVEVYFDAADASLNSGNGLAENDVVQAIDVPAGTYVLSAGIEVVTAGTAGAGTPTFDFGITGGNVDVYVDGGDPTTAGNMAEPAATAGATGKFFNTADTLDILVLGTSATVTAGVFRVWALMVDCNSHLGVTTSWTL